jgi:hypothetical protein
VAHVVGALISWTLGGLLSAFPAWALAQWGHEILFGPRDRAKAEKENRS